MPSLLKLPSSIFRACKHADEEGKVCRFCLGEEGEDIGPIPDLPDTLESIANLGDFVAPCPCRGSAKCVHLGCLMSHFILRGDWHNFRCPTCKQGYEGWALRELAHISCAKMAEKFGKESPQVAHSLCYLAQAHAQLGDARSSKELLEEGLRILEGRFGAGHVATAAMLAELASAHGKLGDVNTQKELLERSLKIKEQYFGPGHINTAVTLNNLATAHSELGNVRQEKDLLERSLEIKERHYGKGHVQTTAALVNLAGVYGEMGDVPKAREFLEWSLNIEERHFGPGHVETAITLNNLALAYGEDGDLERMRELLVRSLSIKEQHFGPDHAELCLTLANLGMVCGALGEEAAALSHCGRACHICSLPESPSSSRRHGVVLLRAASVQVALAEEASNSEAEDLLASSVATLQKALGPVPSARVLSLEAARMCRIWSAANRFDVVTRLRSLLADLGVAPPLIASI